ncbi:RNase adapter RapZ [Desulfohalobium retbaense]|uniref:Uncharacterized protein n=1 Tax=Desulfohalobium retbaense (strain ATCC 49708 / DSM 5692 / JCM 16813 / HR100) TaxID=485915 RepID=C8X385_DESRD|nr:RNase adapter RapZ [Desulfohalobium retbaense]ACV68882.1 conserved hypothetical protein [Desulfohalobium retbaense DSM 5692]
MSPCRQIPLVLLAGLAGAGKSTGLNVFEDLRFFCVDGLPVRMVERMVRFFCNENPRGYRGLAVGIDVRQSDFAAEWEQLKRTLEAEGVTPQLIFFEARPEVLIRRYATTRRPHPLESRDMGLEQALEHERALLEPLRDRADLVVDTSEFSVHDLRRHLQDKWQFLEETTHGLRVYLTSFGFKYGVPSDADLVFDLRFLPNPYFEPDLRPLTGKDGPVAAYVLDSDPGAGFIERFIDFLDYLLPLYAAEGRYRLTLALGCTGGRHRSVAVTEALAKALGKNQYEVSVEHRHWELG